MNARQIKQEAARKSALMERLRQPNPPTDAASLARSFGLPETIVQQMMREI